jgi:hypothetical protein
MRTVFARFAHVIDNKEKVSLPFNFYVLISCAPVVFMDKTAPIVLSEEQNGGQFLAKIFSICQAPVSVLPKSPKPP